MSISDRASRLTIAIFCFASAFTLLSRSIFPQYTTVLWLLGAGLMLVALVLALLINRPGKRFYLLVLLLLLAPWLIWVVNRTV